MRESPPLLSYERFDALAREGAPLLSLAQRERAGLTRQQRGLLERLFEQLNARLFRFARKRCGSESDASDITQEALLVILRRLPELGDEVKLLPWCLGVVRVLCMKRGARDARAKDRSLEAHLEERGHPDALIDSQDNPAEHASKGSDREELARGIQSLEPLYREVLLLRDIEGLSATETALVVNASVSAVKSRLHRARADLRVALSAQTPPPALPDDCPDIRRVFSEHLEGDLKPSLCAEMESHVRGCLICARECDELKATMSICSSTPSKLPAELAVQLKARIQAWLERNPSPSTPI